MLPLYGFTIFLSAALLFSIQPLFGRMVLPQLGGTPAVWNTCMFFFQAMLLAGYGYAHIVTTWVARRWQPWLHMVVVLSALAMLPIGLSGTDNIASSSHPLIWLLSVLTIGVGLPFFVVSTTSPLLQRWFSTTDHPSAEDPYFLYAASNVGSMLALLSYPFAIETTLRLDEQARYWSVGYGLLAVLICGCAISSHRTRTDAVVPKSDNEAPAEPVSHRMRFRWVVLSFVPSSWMLGVTTFLTSDISPIPLLWIIPLATYLLTFILTFSQRQFVSHGLMLRLFPLAMIVLAASLIIQGTWQVPMIHLLAFFVGAMVSHGDLARSRPPASRLTEYYLWISVGGLLGGVFHALAPLMFPIILEYAITILIACLLRKSYYRPRDDIPEEQRKARRWLHSEIGWLIGLIVILIGIRQFTSFAGNEYVVTLVICGVPFMMLLYVLDATRLFAVVLSALMICDSAIAQYAAEQLHVERSFFGVHRVTLDPDGFRRLTHGRTSHGMQRPGKGDCTPRSYYHPTGPLGDVFRAVADRNGDIAAVGLGTGAAVCYRKPGRSFTFYEIDPAVKRIAESPEFFTYLSDCSGGDYRIVLGDGRMRLAEAPDGKYGVILFDAFSSDAVPVHLLTREAIAMYRTKITPQGLLVFHVSNNHLDLKPVLASLAQEANMVCYTRVDLLSREDDRFTGRMPSTYVVLANDKSQLGWLEESPVWRDITSSTDMEPWTDDFSSLIPILKWWR